MDLKDLMWNTPLQLKDRMVCSRLSSLFLILLLLPSLSSIHFPSFSHFGDISIHRVCRAPQSSLCPCFLCRPDSGKWCPIFPATTSHQDLRETYFVNVMRPVLILQWMSAALTAITLCQLWSLYILDSHFYSYWLFSRNTVIPISLHHLVLHL